VLADGLLLGGQAEAGAALGLGGDAVVGDESGRGHGLANPIDGLMVCNRPTWLRRI
jgi:hypothetical protein